MRGNSSKCIMDDVDAWRGYASDGAEIHVENAWVSTLYLTNEVHTRSDS